ncbi:alpha/beta hydrolase [Streptomyces althioticus]|uniref:Alpha/beta hydrolase n=2 Tax=Streptomyces althioticus group TaxID=2867194 RepID=A0ABZ1XXZ2_9ACTN|nr:MULTISPECIES: alpha/beta fold hydrolase [Actinomycetes]WTB96326.1 alpha/beta hydrolase [Streptomyces althioticus]GGT39030.1 alpha/beta hydrolase [Streptomyces matensis]KEG38389.1 alpha/beta hydrolase [Streptomyces griseorubens]MBM4827029.1 alpha/beta fold hydrolase [Actinospica acidiphila]GGQ54411.1 alpha/beta hydrolase [Streptomyces althioticus]
MTDTYRQPGVVLTDRRFTVPLDHDNPSGETIELYAREVVARDKADRDLPWLLYLQGGPGFGANRFVGKPAWLGRALDDYRVLLLDQRGTGASTPANRQTLPLRGGPAEQADHLTHFRSDAIVRDCEAIRPQVTGGARWTVLGQSFGGFCTVAYLSLAPEGLDTALITGGLPSLDAHADDVYRAAYPRIERKVAAHYARYPQDVERARRIADHLLTHDVVLPNGYRFTVEAFQSLGLMLGGGDGSHRLHFLLEDAFVPTPSGPALSDAFQEEVQGLLSFAGHPLYALIHEAIYAQDARPTAWSAERVRAEFPQFDAAKALAGDQPVLFTGETIHPWTFECDPALRPLRETAELLAARTDWTPLYDPARLAANEVPAAAAVYHDDMYVDTAHSLATARAVRGLRTWVTDEFEHDGVRAGGPRVLDRLLALARGDA